MTLKEWASANNVVVQRHPAGAYFIPEGAIPSEDARWQLFRLDGVLVLSVVAGTIWLVGNDGIL